MDNPIWEGIYNDINDIKIVGGGFNSSAWVENSKKKVESYFSALEEGRLIPPNSIRPTSLPLVAAMLDQSQDSNKEIIDFGGGLGFSYLSFLNCYTQANYYNYHIIESEEICKTGKVVFSDYSNLSFYSDIKELNIVQADIFYMNSVLQYIEDWKSMITDLLNFNPKYVLLDDVPAGDIPTYASAQNYNGSKIPRWFFNVNELVSCFESQKYTLEYKSTFLYPILGKIQKKPMDHFPPQYQLDYPCTLLFKR